MPTLYLKGHETEARVENDNVEVSAIDREKDDVRTVNIPFFDISRVVVVGRASLTTPLIHRLTHHGIPITFLASSGRWLGTLEPNANGHALRRLRQYELAHDKSFALDIGRRAVTCKIRNSRRGLQRLAANRGAPSEPEQLRTCDTLQEYARKAGEAADLGSLRGFEGVAGAAYFQRLRVFFPETVPFQGRNRRPPKDAANALLSWTYTITLSEIDGALRAAGLDPCLGFLHEVSYGRPSLSLDLLEPLRPALCDLLVLRILNHKLLKPEHFEFHSDDGGTYLSRDARRGFFMEYERSMTRRFAPAKGAPHTDFRGVIRSQTESLLRALERRGDAEFFRMP